MSEVKGPGPTNPELFSGLADVYNAYRPQPPEVLVDILTRRAGVQRPELVVDIGCGTGHSTFLWVEHANRIIGVEPNDDMRRVAQQRKAIVPRTDHVSFHETSATATGLAPSSADIVTFSQSLHHVEPEATFAEVARILRPGGVMAAYDYQFPPLIDWRVEKALMELFQDMQELRDDLAQRLGMHWWAKETHRERIVASRYFRQVTQFSLHNVEMGNAERLIGLVESLGTLQTLISHDHDESELGLDEFRRQAQELLGEEMQPWYVTYQVVVALK